MTPFVLQLNHLTEGLRRVLPPTDTRLRPDLRLLEQGNLAQVEMQRNAKSGSHMGFMLFNNSLVWRGCIQRPRYAKHWPGQVGQQLHQAQTDICLQTKR